MACLGDSGYQGLDSLHANSRTPRKKTKKHPLTSEQKAGNRQISRRRIGCEHVIGRLKVFRILSERYRILSERYRILSERYRNRRGASACAST